MRPEAWFLHVKKEGSCSLGWGGAVKAIVNIRDLRRINYTKRYNTNGQCINKKDLDLTTIYNGSPRRSPRSSSATHGVLSFSCYTEQHGPLAAWPKSERFPVEKEPGERVHILGRTSVVWVQELPHKPHEHWSQSDRDSQGQSGMQTRLSRGDWDSEPESYRALKLETHKHFHQVIPPIRI